MRKPYQNKTHYDTGRFRFKLEFYEVVSLDNSGGGITPSTAKVYETYGVQEPIKSGNQEAIEAGASVLNQDCYFVVRNNPSFTIEKSFLIVCNSITYNIAAIISVDVPINYIKLLCKTKQ